jgi:hypothetical protein
MKRKCLFFVSFLLSSGILLSQNIGRDVFSAAGGVVVGPNIQLSWTIGQSGLVGPLVKNDVMLHQGFEQENDDLFVAVIDIEQQEISIDMFPNPVTEAAYIKFTSEIHATYSLSLFDYKGTLVALEKNKPLFLGNSIETIRTIDLFPGMYFIHLVITPDGKESVQHSLKMIKI